ncbi:hypothetical protein D3C81_2043980 [compost metagenome]
MGRKSKVAPDSFEAAFNERLEGLIERGKAIGMTLTDICNDANVARATPDRWRANTPLTVVLIDRMEKAVAEAEAKAGKQ